jgi:tetratricopeptide (TPR) repeat protein
MPELTPHEAPVTAIADLPLMHPGRPIGRDDLLKTLLGALKQNEAVLLQGASGIGKTTVAVTIASAYAQQPDQSVLWLNVDNPPLVELVARIGRAYQDNDISTSQNPLSKVGTVANLLSQNKPLIVLDGEIQADVLAQFTERCGGNIPMLITNSATLTGDNWTNQNVGKLSDTHAAVLFKQKSGIKDNKFDIDVYAIAKSLNFEPYPLALAARAMTASKQTPREYDTTLKEIVKSVGDNGSIAALTASYRSLNQALQGLLLMLGATLRGEGSSAFLSMVGGVPQANIDQAMTILSQLFLVEKFDRNGESYYRLHKSVHSFLETWLRASNRMDSLRDKIKDTMRKYIQQYSETPDAYVRLATEMDNFIATARWAADNGDRDLANAIVVALTQAEDFVQSEGYIYEMLLLRAIGSGSTNAFPAYGEDEESIPEEELDYDLEDEELEELELANIEDDDEDEVDDSTFIEREDLNLQSINIDQLRTALHVARQNNEVHRQVQILKAIGKVQISQEREQEAIATYNDALQIYEETEDKEGLLETIDMLSGLLIRTDNAQAAVVHVNRGLGLAEELNDKDTEMHLLTTLGDAHQELGESSKAVEAYESALAIARKRDDKQNEAVILYKLGIAHLENGDPDHAVQTLEQANELFKEQGKRALEGQALAGLGSANAELQRWSEAVNYHTSALHISREVEDKEEEALQLSNLGQALVEAKRLPEALLRYRQALHVAYLTEKKDNIVSAVVELVTLMMKSLRLVPIAELLINDAMNYDATDRDVLRIRDEIAEAKQRAEETGKSMAVVAGTAKDYAANAYDE